MAASRKSRIPSRAIYNAPPLCPKLPFVEYPGNRQYLAQLPPLATPLGVWGGERSSVPNGTGVSNIDLSRSPSHSLSLLHLRPPLALSLSLSFSSFLFLRVAQSSAANKSGDRGGTGEGRVHQEVPAKAQERRTFTSRTNTRTRSHHSRETCPDHGLPNLPLPKFLPSSLVFHPATLSG